jgi:oligosaccharide repeat unit polymerase
MVFLVNYSIAGKTLFYPSVLFSFLWTGILLLHFICGFTVLGELYPVSIETFLVLFIGNVCFSLGAFIVTASRKKENYTSIINQQPPAYEFNISSTLRMIFLGIVIVGLPLYIQASFRVFLASQIDNFFAGLRTELAYGEEDIGPTKYLVSFSFAVFGIQYYASLKEGGKLNKILLATSFILAVVYSVFATGRTYFLMILTIYLGISYLLQKNFSLRKYALAFLLFMPVFIFIGMIYGKGGNMEDSLKNNLKASSESTGIYLVSAVNALDNELTNKIEITNQGENTLLFFIKIGQQLHLIKDKKVGSLVKEFVFIPYPTNVYTFYSPYIHDFGKLYAWIMIALFGALHTWVFHKALKRKSLRNTLYYSFLLYPLLMSFFQDQYISLFSTWLQMVFYIEAFCVLNNFFLKRNS